MRISRDENAGTTNMAFTHLFGEKKKRESISLNSTMCFRVSKCQTQLLRFPAIPTRGLYQLFQREGMANICMVYIFENLGGRSIIYYCIQVHIINWNNILDEAINSTDFLETII